MASSTTVSKLGLESGVTKTSSSASTKKIDESGGWKIPDAPSKTWWLIGVALALLLIVITGFLVVGRPAPEIPPPPPRDRLTKTWKCDVTKNQCFEVDGAEFFAQKSECELTCLKPRWGCATQDTQGIAGLRTGKCELTPLKERQCADTQEECEQGKGTCPACNSVQAIRCDRLRGCILSSACPANDPACWMAAPDAKTGNNPAATDCTAKCQKAHYCDPARGCVDLGFVPIESAQIWSPGVICTLEKPCLGTCTPERSDACAKQLGQIKGWHCQNKLKCIPVLSSDSTTRLDGKTMEECLQVCCANRTTCGASCLSDPNFKCCVWTDANGKQHQDPYSPLQCQVCNPTLGVIPTCLGGDRCSRCINGKCEPMGCGPTERCAVDPVTQESRCVALCPDQLTKFCFDPFTGRTWCVPLHCTCSRTTPENPSC